MRNASIAVLREIGVETGGSNVQFAVNPADGRMVVIEMNPRVSRSSALASKATGFPIAKVAAKLAVGYTLDELANDITGVTPGLVRADDRLRRHQDPALRLREIPRRRAAADHLDEIGRRGDGDRPHLRRVAAEGAALAGDRARPASTRSTIAGVDGAGPRMRVRRRSPGRRPTGCCVIAQAFRTGLTVDEIHAACHYDPWFLRADRRRSSRPRSEVPAETACRRTTTALLRAEADGLLRRAARPASPASRRREVAASRAARLGRPPGLQAHRHLRRRVRRRSRPTCTRPTRRRSASRRPNARPSRATGARSIILGGGPNRIGQGIEFDYCCVHAAFALARGRHRDDHGQLQSGDRLDRLRHLRPALFRAADRRGRARDRRGSSSAAASCSASSCSSAARRR